MFDFVFVYPCIVLSDFNTAQKIHKIQIHMDEVVCVNKCDKRIEFGLGDLSGHLDRTRCHHRKKKEEKYSLIDIKCCIAVTSIYIVYVYVLLSL